MPLLILTFVVIEYRPLEGDVFEIYSDADHHGSSKMHSKSQSGYRLLLNGVPVRWRSAKQPKTVDSPACAEIYAAKDAVKETRLQMWVAEEMGMQVSYPFIVQVDSAQAMSFSGDTCPKSKLRGTFDMREAWIKEMRNDNVVKLVYVHRDENLADMFTKCLKCPEFVTKRNMAVDFQKCVTLGKHK